MLLGLREAAERLVSGNTEKLVLAWNTLLVVAQNVPLARRFDAKTEDARAAGCAVELVGSGECS